MTPTAANQIYRKQTSDDDSLASSQQTKNENHKHSRLGRKGDPRMHRAVAARLAKPDLTLIEALRIGGFDYPEDVHDDHCILANDTVSLGQRKNQLSRRCRLAKHQSHSSDTKKEGLKRRSNARTTSDKQAELDKIMSIQESQEQDFPPERRGKKREHSLADDAMDDMDEQEEALARIARQRMAKFHPEYHPILVPPAHISLGNLTKQSTSSSLLGSQVTLADDIAPARGMNAGPMPPTSSGGTPSFALSLKSHQQPHATGVAVASLNATAASVGLTLEQLAVALSSTTSLAKVLSDQSIPDMKQDLALNLYRAECSTLYQRCMLLAGYDLEETNEASTAYKLFAFKAWSEEGKRLEQQIGRLDPSPPPPELPHESADGKIPAMRVDHSRNHGKSCCSGEEKCYADDKDGCCTSGNEDRACFDGRHVHRLEGKCGHKAIIHQPDGAPAHVDFVVNGKVECYEGIRPVGNNAAMWPSRYNCKQLSCPTDSNPHKVRKQFGILCPSHFVTFSQLSFALVKLCQVACECENECTVKNYADPKEFPLSAIDLDGKEWDQDFFENNNGNENSLAGLIQLGSEDGKNTQGEGNYTYL